MTHLKKQIREQRKRIRSLVLDSDTPGAFEVLEKELSILKMFEKAEAREK